jgi:hypothetical protein
LAAVPTSSTVAAKYGVSVGALANYVAFPSAVACRICNHDTYDLLNGTGNSAKIRQKRQRFWSKSCGLSNSSNNLKFYFPADLSRELGQK